MRTVIETILNAETEGSARIEAAQSHAKTLIKNAEQQARIMLENARSEASEIISARADAAGIKNEKNLAKINNETSEESRDFFIRKKNPTDDAVARILSLIN